MILSFLKLYQRPNHNSVTRVEPNGKISFVASHTYMYKPGYTREMVYKISCCLQIRKKLSKYIYDKINIYSFWIAFQMGVSPWTKVPENILTLSLVQADPRSLSSWCIQFTLKLEYVLCSLNCQMSTSRWLIPYTLR